MVLLLATGNKGKVAEVRAISAPYRTSGQFSLVDLSTIDKALEMPEETGTTYQENSRIKAVAIAKATGMISIADDSGLEVAALDGRPGLYSSRYGTSDSDRIERMLAELDGMMPTRARFICVATVAKPDGSVESFEGVIEGEIVSCRAGSSGFGFDPIFRVADYGCTMAELSTDVKNKISHRAVAFKKLFEHVLASENLCS